MDAHNENFYISPELSEVIDLVIKRQELLIVLDTDEAIEEEYCRITARLEKLVIKHEIALDTLS